MLTILTAAQDAAPELQPDTSTPSSQDDQQRAPSTAPFPSSVKSSPSIRGAELTNKLATITTLVQQEDLEAAYRVLTCITTNPILLAAATVNSWSQIFSLTQYLGDGGTQGLEQARTINASQRREMELERQMKGISKGERSVEDEKGGD